jgi:hypothetical protein
MEAARHVVRMAAGMLLVLHGFAHTPGVLGSWKLATFEDVSYQPNVLLDNANAATIALLGAVFLLGGVAFIVAGLGVMRRSDWWLQWAGLAVLTSLFVTVLWWENAIAGLVINLIVLLVLAGTLAFTTFQPGQRHTVASP